MRELVTKEFWEVRHGGYVAETQRRGLPPRRGLRQLLDRVRHRVGAEATEAYPDFLFRRCIEQFLPARQDWLALEIGCAPGHHIIDLHRRFGYRPFGVEYSEIGVEETRRTFAANGCDPADVIHADFFDPAFRQRYRDAFDVVSSGGFIEHFDDPRSVVRAHIELLKPGGYLICSVPNLLGWGFPFLALMGWDLLRAHNLSIMRQPSFQALFAGAGMEQLFCGYVGQFRLFGVILRHESSLRGAVAKAADRMADGANHLMFALLSGRSWETRFSPHLLYVGRKVAP